MGVGGLVCGRDQIAGLCVPVCGLLVGEVCGRGPVDKMDLALAPTPFYEVSREQIQQWADEAEAGYNVDDLKRRVAGARSWGSNRRRSWPSG